MRALARRGAGADVFSSGELHLALQAGIPAEKLLFNGSSKTPQDLELAVRKEVRVSVDSLDELHQLDDAAKAAGKTAKISFRVNGTGNPHAPKDCNRSCNQQVWDSP